MGPDGNQTILVWRALDSTKFRVYAAPGQSWKLWLPFPAPFKWKPSQDSSRKSAMNNKVCNDR